LVASAVLHARPPGEDHQVGAVQAAGLGVEVAQAGRQAAHAAGRGEGALGG
jgi:hypothetical protein